MQSYLDLGVKLKFQADFTRPRRERKRSLWASPALAAPPRAERGQTQNARPSGRAFSNDVHRGNRSDGTGGDQMSCERCSPCQPMTCGTGVLRMGTVRPAVLGRSGRLGAVSASMKDCAQWSMVLASRTAIMR